MSLKDKIKTPDRLVDQQGAKLLIYGPAIVTGKLQYVNHII